MIFKKKNGIQKLREAARMTRKEFAEHLDVTDRRIVCWENDYAPHTMRALAEMIRMGRKYKMKGADILEGVKYREDK